MSAADDELETRLHRAEKAAMLAQHGRADTTNHAILGEIIGVGGSLPIPFTTEKATRPTIVVFADDGPLFNWSHPCRYLLHDADSGEIYREIPAEWPPHDPDRDVVPRFRSFHVGVRPIARATSSIPAKGPWRPLHLGRRHALLFSGLSNLRHVNDLEFLYRTLVDVYQYKPKDITVLNCRGALEYSGWYNGWVPADPAPVPPCWPGDNTPYRLKIDGAGTCDLLLNTLANYGRLLGPADNFLIYITNHGTLTVMDSKAAIQCYPYGTGTRVVVDDFARQLRALPRFSCLMVMMQQCFAGGFNEAVIEASTADRTSIASACRPGKESVGGGGDFDPFSNDWIAAMAGRAADKTSLAFDPDANGDGRVSAREAFDYAWRNKVGGDSPVFCERGGGGSCALGGSLFPFFRLSWDDDHALRDLWGRVDFSDESRAGRVLEGIADLERELAVDRYRLSARFAEGLGEILREAVGDDARD